MFTEQTHKPFVQVIKIYLRLKDKRSFPVMLKLPVVTGDLKDIVIKKTKIPSDDLIIVTQGKQINLKNSSDILHLQDKSILHIINKKYLRNDIFELQIRLVLRNQEKSCLGEVELVAKADQLIKEFVEDKLLPVIEERTGQQLKSDCVNLVSNGTVLNKNLKFNHYLIQNGAEVICMINFIEELRRSVKNLSSHKLIGSHRQMQLYQSLNFQPGEKKDTVTSLEQLKINPHQQLEPKKKQSKKTQKQLKKTRLEKKIKKPQTEHKQKLSPTLFPEFSDLLHKDITDGYSEEEVPQSPVIIEYPKIQRKSETNVQWYDQKQEEKNQMPSQEFQLQEIQKPEEKTGKLQQFKVQKKDQKEKQEKIKFYQQRTEICKVLLGDFLTIDSTKSAPLTKTSRNEFLEEMNEQVQNFLSKKYDKTEVSQVQLEFPKLQKKIPVKSGDFIICKDKFMSSSKLIRQNLLQKFNKLIQQKTTKKIHQDYDLEERLKRKKVQQETSKKTQIAS